MKINLRNYGTELAHWLRAFEPFVEPASQPALSRLKLVLEDGRDNLREKFDWSLKDPIITKIANSYDRRNNNAHEVRVGWQFESAFERGEHSRKKSIWTVGKMVTHIRVYDAANNEVLLHFHVDMKNSEQLGPHIHLQLSEDYMEKRVGLQIAVPRFPFATILPTDCLDFVLSEFFPIEWPRSQSDAQGLATLQRAQRDRLRDMAEAIAKLWDKPSRQTPVSATQDYHMPDLQIA